MSEADISICPKHEATDGPSLLQNGNFVFQTHHVGWIVASFFTTVATITSAWLICKHLMWYTNKREQRYVIRILLLVPVYAIISLLSYFFWTHATPIILIRDCYESTVLTAFFYLLLYYLAPDTDEQRAIFLAKGLSRENDRKARAAGATVRKWVFPMGWVKWKPADGLYFLQWMKWGVLQYCVIRPLTTLIAVIMDYMGLYCEVSWGLEWAHVYIVIIVSISVTIAMYCLIQLYVAVSEELAPQRPLLKLFAVKAVVFLTFWQASFLSLLTMLDVIKDTEYMTAEDINIGIGALLETFEMMVFGFLHVSAFTYKVYRPYHSPDSSELQPKKTPMLRSFLHAMDFRETFREIWQGCKYMWATVRGREPKYDQGVRRVAHYESAFGKARPIDGTRGDAVISKSNLADETPMGKRSATLPDVHLNVAAEDRTERLWLGHGDDYPCDLHPEKTDGLEAQVEQELANRGYASDIPGKGHIKAMPAIYGGPEAEHGKRRSWWRNLYNSVSSSGYEANGEDQYSSPLNQLPKHHFRKGSHHRILSTDIDGERRFLVDPQLQHDFEDPPPPSLIRQSRGLPQPRYDYLQNEDGILSPWPDEQLSVYSERQSSHQQERHLASPPSTQQHRSSRRQQSPAPLADDFRFTESLWGHIFAPSIDHATSDHAHLAHGTHSIHHRSIGLAGERPTGQAYVAVEQPMGISVDVVHSDSLPPASDPTQRAHSRDPALHEPTHVTFPGQSAPVRARVESSPQRSKAARRDSGQLSPRYSHLDGHGIMAVSARTYIPQPRSYPDACSAYVASPRLDSSGLVDQPQHAVASIFRVPKPDTSRRPFPMWQNIRLR